LYNLARKAQPQRAHRESKLQHFPSRSLKDPVEGECEREEGDVVECFVGLTVGGNFVVGAGEAAGGRDEDDGDEGRWGGLSAIL